MGSPLWMRNLGSGRLISSFKVTWLVCVCVSELRFEPKMSVSKAWTLSHHRRCLWNWVPKAVPCPYPTGLSRAPPSSCPEGWSLLLGNSSLHEMNTLSILCSPVTQKLSPHFTDEEAEAQGD